MIRKTITRTRLLLLCITGVVLVTGCPGLLPPTEDELPLYEWEVVDVFANELASNLEIMCRDNGSGAPTDVYTTYRDFKQLELIGLTSFKERTYSFQGVSTDLPGYYDTGQEGIIEIYISGITPPPNSTVDMEISFDTETIFFLYNEGAHTLSGHSLYGKCRLKTVSVPIQYR